MPKTQPGVVTQQSLREDDLLVQLMNSIDNITDDVIGVRFIRPAARVLSTIAPANVLSEKFHVPKLSVWVERQQDQLEARFRYELSKKFPLLGR